MGDTRRSMNAGSSCRLIMSAHHVEALTPVENVVPLASPAVWHNRTMAMPDRLAGSDMASITIVTADDASLVGTIVPLPMTEIIIGRDPGNDLVLTTPLASRRHARIRPGERGFVLEDLGSSNGLTVNGQRVTQHELVAGDRIQIGQTMLLFEAAPRPACCGGCGNTLDRDARFCPTCGLAVKPAPQPEPSGPSLPVVSSVPAPSQAAADPIPTPARAAEPARPRTRRKRSSIGLAAALLAVVGTGAVLLALHLRQPRVDPRPPTAPTTRLDAELEAAARFRTSVSSGWASAIQRFATPEAAQRIEAISEAIWPDARQPAGWVYLLETALVCPGARTGNLRPVAFYHPFSDVFLITVWETSSPHRMVDAELLMGDFVRRRGALKLEMGLPAAYQAIYLPLAIGLWAGETVSAYERLLGNSATQGDFRAALPALRNPRLLEANRSGAALQIAANMAPLGVLALPDSNALRTRQIRAAIKRLAQAVRSGEVGQLLSQTNATSETRHVLTRLPADAWSMLKPVAYRMGARHSLILLSKSDQTDLYLALRFAHEAEATRLERVDLFSFNAIYRDFPTIKRRVGL